MSRFTDEFRRAVPLVISTTFWAFTSQGLLAQEIVQNERVETKSFRAVRVNTAPVMDGRLDDEVWQQAIPVSDFHQNRPGDHAVPSEPTEVYVVYTADALYIGARMLAANPTRLPHPPFVTGKGCLLTIAW